MGEIVGGWDRPDVAHAQYDLAMCELRNDDGIFPFAAFKWAMGHVNIKTGTLLDVGCGVGNYAALCERNYPGIAYTGTDINPFAIDAAKKLASSGTFEICRFEDNAFGDYDIILASGIIEVTDDPIASLELLLGRARRYIVLNRLRLICDASRQIEETTYCGYIGRFFEWNVKEIVGIINKHAPIIAWRDWDTQTTLVIEKSGECRLPVYDGNTRKDIDFYIYRPYDIVYGNLH